LSTTQRLVQTLVVLPLCIVALGCGAVGEPRPPLLNIPERAGDFVALQTPVGILLEWTWPRVTTEGVVLDDLSEFDVYVFELAPGSSLPDAGLFERESRPLATMRGDDLTPYSAGDRVRYLLAPEPLLGKLLALGVRAESRRGRSVGFSNLALIQVTRPPGQPAAPSATLARDAIVLEWPAVERASGYIVDRSSDPAGPFETIGRSDANRFRDTGFEMGATYVYRVRAIAGTTAAAEAEGPWSEAVSITARDIFAPEKPAGLRAVATDASVELSWEQNAEPDLAGYRVRRSQPDSEPAALTEELLTSPSYSDRNVTRGQEYSYQVTAVDDKGNESELSDPIKVRMPE
jgi:Fibronectin type III domain